MKQPQSISRPRIILITARLINITNDAEIIRDAALTFTPKMRAKPDINVIHGIKAADIPIIEDGKSL
jgi:hypothetical protein